MSTLLKLLASCGRCTDAELAERLSIDESDVQAQRKALEAEGAILGYQAIINDEVRQNDIIQAFIEVKVRPERGGGFDVIANRIARFPEVISCYLASGGFDLLVVVEGQDMRAIATFVAEKLAGQQGVISFSTHFHLKTYKKNGFHMEKEEPMERLAITP